ncbi:MAG: hypothetical protein JO011_19850 [Ktedonobacteraceae bacterium]|nr:hypothetical protein [Ktedonobacteraceae bacterium]MBV9713163.1 hypothetical protein [Ktedonobacteraceae bacterium]
MMTTTSTLNLVRDDDLQQHLEDDVTSAAQITPITRPHRFNRELYRHETFCCGHWWPGDTCFYGNHRLNTK